MVARFEIQDLPLEGLKLIGRNPHIDSRGYLERLFCRKELKHLIPDRIFDIIQINHTLTFKSGTVRGLHFQYPPFAEMKLITCIRGRVFDVAVDLRNNSSSYAQWHSEILSEENRKLFWIPEGFAHGFQSLTENCEMLYFHNKAYEKLAEGGLNALDPKLDIPWPKRIVRRSSRDSNLPILDSDFNGIYL